MNTDYEGFEVPISSDVPTLVWRSPIRTFETGATRNTDTDKYDYEGFLSPLVLEAYAAYMHQNRQQADGTYRDSDNWQKGMPQDQYLKSGFRHFMEWWKLHRAEGPKSQGDQIEAACALLFNVMGWIYEELKKK